MISSVTKVLVCYIQLKSSPQSVLPPLHLSFYDLVANTMQAILYMSLKVRIAEHRGSIECKNLTFLVAAHFIPAGHPLPALRYVGTENVSQERRRL